MGKFGGTSWNISLKLINQDCERFDGNCASIRLDNILSYGYILKYLKRQDISAISFWGKQKQKKNDRGCHWVLKSVLDYCEQHYVSVHCNGDLCSITVWKDCYFGKCSNAFQFSQIEEKCREKASKQDAVRCNNRSVIISSVVRQCEMQTNLTTHFLITTYQ